MHQGGERGGGNQPVPMAKQKFLYKTELCRTFFESGSCPYKEKCRFAHGNRELRSVVRHPKYKTEICKSYVETGTCSYGQRCKFLHLPLEGSKGGDDQVSFLEVLGGIVADLVYMPISYERFGSEFLAPKVKNSRKKSPDSGTRASATSTSYLEVLANDLKGVTDSMNQSGSTGYNGFTPL